MDTGGLVILKLYSDVVNKKNLFKLFICLIKSDKQNWLWFWFIQAVSDVHSAA